MLKRLLTPLAVLPLLTSCNLFTQFDADYGKYDVFCHALPNRERLIKCDSSNAWKKLKKENTYTQARIDNESEAIRLGKPRMRFRDDESVEMIKISDFEVKHLSSQGANFYVIMLIAGTPKCDMASENLFVYVSKNNKDFSLHATGGCMDPKKPSDYSLVNIKSGDTSVPEGAKRLEDAMRILDIGPKR